jgi:hypothetical protein
MGDNLETTNFLLTIMAVVSVIEGLLLVGVGVAGWTMYRRAAVLIETVESRLGPTLTRVNGILDTLATLNGILGDLQKVTATVRNETERVDLAVNRTFERVDDTVDRMRTNVRAKTSRLIGLVRGARVALQSILQSA